MHRALLLSRLLLFAILPRLFVVYCRLEIQEPGREMLLFLGLDEHLDVVSGIEEIRLHF